jgi:hypothetical protein
MRNGAAAVTMVDTRLLSGTVLPNLAPVYDASTGVATWNFDTGIADQYTIPANDTLRIVYQAQAETAIGAGMTLTNQAQVQLYYSFDDEAVPILGGVNGVRQVYGPSNVAASSFTTATPDALVKQNPAVTSAAVGQPFTYRITVPGTPQAVALYDVRILDDLSASAADLGFVGVTKVFGSRPWTPVNTGSPTNLVIEDTTIGIDIPAGEQIVVYLQPDRQRSRDPGSRRLGHHRRHGHRRSGRPRPAEDRAGDHARGHPGHLHLESAQPELGYGVESDHHRSHSQ